MAMVHKFNVMKPDDAEWEEMEISIHDSFIFPNHERFKAVDTFWGRCDKKTSKGLDYCGYTYIPPESMDALLNAVKGVAGLEELEKLALFAKEKNARIEHIGL